MIERIHFEIIMAVDECGSLTAAAEKLHLTQSALSHSVRKLEDQIGTPIWRREGRSLLPTQTGEYLTSISKRVISQFEHIEERLRQFSRGERGTLRIGMECHPCYQWLLRITKPYLSKWREVDLDVRQKFQFGGVGALFSYEIDLLVTPDPLVRKELYFEPVFDYEQVLVVAKKHPLHNAEYVLPKHIAHETLITYPVSLDRLDIFTRFLTPAGVYPKRHKLIETTDIMLQMIASGRGVGALPRWLVEENAKRFSVVPVRLGKKGVDKKIHLGVREADLEIDYIKAFLELARSMAEND